jgi:hypothetical protein
MRTHSESRHSSLAQKLPQPKAEGHVSPSLLKRAWMRTHSDSRHSSLAQKLPQPKAEGHVSPSLLLAVTAKGRGTRIEYIMQPFLDLYLVDGLVGFRECQVVEAPRVLELDSHLHPKL